MSVKASFTHGCAQSGTLLLAAGALAGKVKPLALAGTLALRFRCGGGGGEGMPRTVFSKVRVDMPTLDAWRLRNSFALEQTIATGGRRRLTLLDESVENEGREDEQRQRVSRCDLLGDHLGGGLMGIKTSDLASELSCSYFVNLFDEAHGAQFSVELALRRLNVSIVGYQWCVPVSETSCFLCTRVEVKVPVLGVGGMVEMQLERHMRASHADFPKHAYAFANATRALAEAPTSAPAVEVVGASSCGVAELPECFERSAGDPKLDGWRLLQARLADCLHFTSKRHRMLNDKRPLSANTVAVRVGRRHARALFFCGCASAIVDSDEIVE